MIHDCKKFFRSIVFGSVLCLAFANGGFARPPAPTDDQEDVLDGADPVAAAGQLATQVREIANSHAISRAKKEKRISTAVRIAVVTVTTYQHDPASILATAVGLAERAAHAAPGYAEVIANAVAFAPAVARIESAQSRIRTAAFAAARAPRGARAGPDDTGETGQSSVRTRRTAVARGRTSLPGETTETSPDPMTGPASSGADDANEAAPPTAKPRRAVTVSGGSASLRREREEAAPNAESPAGTAEPDYPMEANGPKASMSHDTSFNLTGVIGVRHDDNIFLTTQNKVGDTIISVIPGVVFNYGLNSLTHGSFNFTETFTRYAGKTAPNASLAADTADFGYDNGSLALIGTASYQQLNQNTSATASLGPQIFRRDVLNLAFGAETALTAKTRLRTGANLDQTDYKTAGLIGTRQTEVPLKLYFETTPKTSLSAGATYRDVKPQGDGPKGHDFYYNIGARGAFTAKLSGEISVGYRTRDVGPNPKQNLWGFDGSFNYEATAKTTLALQLSRDFSTGALGESLKTDRYALKFSTTPTPQWSFAANVSYQDSNYGPTLFSVQNLPVTTIRQDGYWEGSLLASYLITSWLTTSADYTLRNNHSTLPTAGYSNNVFNLSVGLKY